SSANSLSLFFFQADYGIRAFHVTGVQTCALPICFHNSPKHMKSLYYLLDIVEARLQISLRFGQGIDQIVMAELGRVPGGDADGRSEERRVGTDGSCKLSMER